MTSSGRRYSPWPYTHGTRPEATSIAHLFSLDAYLPSQWDTGHGNRQLSPEERLLEAVLTVALDDCRTPKHNREAEHLRRQALSWIWDDRDEWPCSFLAICETLHLDPQAVRQRAVRLQERGELSITRQTRATVQIGLHNRSRMGG